MFNQAVVINTDTPSAGNFSEFGDNPEVRSQPDAAIVFLFGLPGTGKTFIGNYLQEHFDFYFYEADTDMSPSLRTAMRSGELTDEMRDEYFSAVIARLKNLTRKHKKVVAAQALVKDKYRQLLANEFEGSIHFVYVQAAKEKRDDRLKNRSFHPVPIEYARAVEEVFEAPTIDYSTLENSSDSSLHDKLGQLLLAQQIN